MAQAFLKNTRLTLVFETGMNEKGEPIYKAKTYTNIKRLATADQLHQAATALAAISTFPLNSVERTDNYDIM
jgi:hypothetical protein